MIRTLYIVLGITLTACILLPEIVPAEIGSQWNEAPTWSRGRSLEQSKRFLVIGSYHGEDLLYLVTRAARITLRLSFIAIFFSVLGGIFVVFLNFYRFTKPIFRGFTRICVYLPRLLLLILLASALKLHQPSELALSVDAYLIVFLATTGAIFLAAQNYGEIDNISQQLFVHFAHSLGISSWQIFLRHILRNCTQLPVTVAKQLRDNIIFLSILSFIGAVHLEPGDLGALINEYAKSPEAYQGWWILFFPCALLCWLVFLFELLAMHITRLMNRSS